MKINNIKDFKFNINSYVKVKLTSLGLAILKSKYDKLNNAILLSGGHGLNEFDSNIDKEGYYTNQMWSIIKDFGAYMDTGTENPFDCNIICCKGEEI